MTPPSGPPAPRDGRSGRSDGTAGPVAAPGARPPRAAPPAPAPAAGPAADATGDVASGHAAGRTAGPAAGPTAGPSTGPAARAEASRPSNALAARLAGLAGRSPAGRAAARLAARLGVSVGDLAFALGICTTVLVMSQVAAVPRDRPLWPGGVALILVACLALAFRRRHPVPVLVIAMTTTPVYYPMAYPDGPIGVVMFIALFSAAVECRLLVSLGAVAAVNAGFLLAGWFAGETDDPEAVVDGAAVASLTLTLLAVVSVGAYVRARRDQAEAAERRAAAAEHDREQEARRRATEERLRIARELHDVLAHQISLINVQAGAALHRRDDPARAYSALEAIKGASKETLRELRGVLGVMRQVDEEDPAAAVAPVPSLAHLGPLLEQTTAAGLRVHHDTSDDTSDDDASGGGASGGGDPALALLPAPVALAGYRIVQEALTNAVRHARARSATVRIRHTGDAVIVQVDDDGTGPADPAALEHGNGLRGMRERAAAVGGEITAGPGPTGGFRVWARLPLPAAALDAPSTAPPAPPDAPAALPAPRREPHDPSPPRTPPPDRANPMEENT
ncbi:sensor histidine kinase [Spirillospora sp. NPDC050679]